MARPKFIEKILQDNPIQDYLSSMGYTYAQQYNNRIKYICPLHGPEKEPSFYLFTDKEYEYFHCYGCSRHGDIVNLVMQLENLSLKQAIYKFIKDGDYTRDFLSEIEEEIDNSFDELGYATIGRKESMGHYAYQISHMVYSYLDYVGFDKLEVEFMENVCKKVDNIILAMDENSLVKIYDFLMEVGIKNRLTEFETRKKEELRKAYKND